MFHDTKFTHVTANFPRIPGIPRLSGALGVVHEGGAVGKSRDDEEIFTILLIAYHPIANSDR